MVMTILPVMPKHKRFSFPKLSEIALQFSPYFLKQALIYAKYEHKLGEGGFQKTESKKLRHAVMPTQMVFRISKKEDKIKGITIPGSSIQVRSVKGLRQRSSETLKSGRTSSNTSVGCFVKGITPNKS